MDKQDYKNLTKRYLIWMYMTTKEAFDRFERKFTQFEMDEFILKEIEKRFKGVFLPHEKKALEKSVNAYRNYISNKEESCLKLKYKGKKIDPEYIFLEVKLEAIEKAILEELGKAELEDIKEMYEDEMIDRIIRNTIHK